jgi:hypothetical protein
VAIVLKFKQGDSGTELDLQGGSTGFQLAGGGWNPAVASPIHMADPSPILESLHLLLKNTSQDNISTNMQSLHEMQVLANRYINDPHSETPVWLHSKLNNETNERRALVRRIEAQFKTSWFGSEATALDIPIVITVVREPYWEATSARDLPDLAPSAAACVTYDYTAAGAAVGAHNIVGDVGARIRLFDILHANKNLRRYWMGIRTADKHGATGISNFVATWEAEAGSPGTDVTETADATASGGTKDVVSESALDWDTATFWRVFLSVLTNVSANEEDQYGNFLWLMRAKVTSGTWEVKIAFEPTSTRDTVWTEVVELTNTSWNYFEMGVQPIGFRNLHAILEGDYAKSAEGLSFTVSPWARRTSGSGDLEVDCLVRIPVDEGFLKIEASADAGTNEHVLFGHAPEGIKSTIAYNPAAANQATQKPAIKGIHNFTLPPGDGRIYCVYSDQAGGADVLADTITFNDGDTGKYYERWLSLRGSE